MKTTFVITDEAGKFASYDMRSGPFLTDVFALSYTWSTREDAEKQLSHYVAALGVPLAVSEHSTKAFTVHRFVQGNPALS